MQTYCMLLKKYPWHWTICCFFFIRPNIATKACKTANTWQRSSWAQRYYILNRKPGAIGENPMVVFSPQWHVSMYLFFCSYLPVSRDRLFKDVQWSKISVSSLLTTEARAGSSSQISLQWKLRDFSHIPAFSHIRKNSQSSCIYCTVPFHIAICLKGLFSEK
jgi:hypothetical protein